MENPKKATADEQYVCEECGTVVPTAEENCPECGAPMVRYGSELDLGKEPDEDDLSDEALHEGINEDDETMPLSLEKLREDEDSDEDLDSYEKGQNGDDI